ncbi:MAG: Holliday junction resolvase RuvX [Planctomycetota bacterium]|nr:Holliday junction resolvase RuvX [Planctomycetota bacterium]
MHDRILGIDYGRVRHGLATSDGLGMTSHPQPHLRRKNDEEDLATIQTIIDEQDICRLVIGLPLNMDGTEGFMAEEVRRFGHALSQTVDLPVTYEDERLTTEEAEEFLSAMSLRPRERRKLRDSVAAAILVRSVLEREKNSSN